MTTLNSQCSSLLLSTLIRVQSKLDNQVYKEMIGQVLWSQLPSDRKNIGLEKQQKNPTYNAFYASKLQDYVEEGLLFQNISKSKNYPCWPWSPISSHNTKLGHATFCWFCDAGSHMFCLYHFYTGYRSWKVGYWYLLSYCPRKPENFNKVGLH